MTITLEKLKSNQNKFKIDGYASKQWNIKIFIRDAENIHNKNNNIKGLLGH